MARSGGGGEEGTTPGRGADCGLGHRVTGSGSLMAKHVSTDVTTRRFDLLADGHGGHADDGGDQADANLERHAHLEPRDQVA